MPYLNFLKKKKEDPLKNAKNIIDKFASGEDVRKLEIIYATNCITEDSDQDPLIEYIKSSGKGSEFKKIANSIFEEIIKNDETMKRFLEMYESVINRLNYRFKETPEISISDEFFRCMKEINNTLEEYILGEREIEGFPSDAFFREYVNINMV